MKALLAALTAAAAPLIGVEAARELAANISMTVLYSDETVESIIEAAIEARMVARAGCAWTLETVNVDRLVDVLIAAALVEVAELRQPCGCLPGGECPDCEAA